MEDATGWVCNFGQETLEQSAESDSALCFSWQCFRAAKE